ncbi:MAG: DUF192 domain-containing protein [Ignavibacteria bacterium]
MHSKRKNLRKNLIYTLLYGFLFLFNFACQKSGEDIKPNNTDKTQYNIKFKKQGEVYFQDKNKSMTKAIDAEIAETPETRHTGLMFRNNMEESQGMLFIFDKEEPEGFYMKNTVIPLDIIFITSKKEIVKIYKHTTPFSEDDLPSIKPILYVVEVNAGFTDKYNIKEGDFIDWKRF